MADQAKLVTAYISGPIILRHADDRIPPRLYERLAMSRWMQVGRAINEPVEADLASELETLAYIYSVSLGQPLTHAWNEIYCYLGQEVFPAVGLMANAQAVAEMLGFTTPVALHEKQLYDLRRLRRWLRDQIVIGMTDGSKTKRHVAREVPSDLTFS